MLSLILHELRSNHNVGSIFRTADAAGVEKIYLTGYTPAPTDKFGRVNNEIAKTALGAEKTVAWEYAEDIFGLINTLKETDQQIWALEQSANSVDYKAVKITKPTAIVVGNEVSGIDQAILKLCDTVIEIPMRGSKESLNVAVATGILLFKLLEVS